MFTGCLQNKGERKEKGQKSEFVLHKLTSFVPAKAFKFDRRSVAVPLAEAYIQSWSAMNH